MRILFTGGGSGGHIFPLIAVVQELKKITREERIFEAELFYMGPRDFGIKFLEEEGVKTALVLAGKFRRYFSFQNFLDPFLLIGGTLQAIFKMFFLMPDVVFSKGGFGSFPAVIAAIIFRIPLVIHESDAVPGRANRFAARFATRIGISFAHAATYFPKEKVAEVGVPIRKQILGANTSDAKQSLHILTQSPIVGFIGASQGAKRINEVLLDALADFIKDFEVIHQTGEQWYEEVRKEAELILEKGGRDRYHPFGFLSERRLAEFYAVSNLVVSRAGASSIYEIAAWGKPAILIPLEGSAQEHQLKNAFEYAGTGAALVVEQANLTPHILLAEIKKVLGNPELMKKMSEAAQRFSKIEAAELIAREIIKIGLH